jgi:4-hydroxy-2-oxoheptanedioate aldolase
MTNPLKQIWQDGGVVINGWLSMPSSFVAEVLAHSGFDSLTLDMQHGLMHYDGGLSMIQAINTTPTVALARVPWNEPGIIMKLLDAGCMGLICPMVNNRAETEAFVGACRYPPLGYRSYGPTRASLVMGSDYAEQANQNVITFAMVETRAAVDNLEDILSTPGLDAIYVGPSDLNQSYGNKPRLDSQEPDFLKLLAHLVARCKAHRIVAGLHTGSTDYAHQMIQMGFQFVTISSDARILSAAAQAAVGAMKTVKGAGPAY